MNHMTRDDIWQAASVAFAEGAFGSMDQAKTWVLRTLRDANELHRLHTKACNEPLTSTDQTRVSAFERQIAADFKNHGLGLYLNRDPRGNPVGILTPKTGRYNTMGGAECGWRL